MIVPMKKITLLVLAREQKEALEVLRKTGVVHVEKRNGSSPGITVLQNLISRVDSALSVLSDAGADGKKAQKEYGERDAALSVADSILELRDKRRAAFDAFTIASNELDRISSWGDIVPDAFSELAKSGVSVRLFEMQAADYAKLDESVRTVVLSKNKKTVRFMVCVFSGEIMPVMPQDAKEFVLPSKSTAELKMDREQASRAIPETLEAILAFGSYTQSLATLKAELIGELEFETIQAGMPVISIEDGSGRDSNNELAWLSGFVPADQVQKVTVAAKENHWALLYDDPSEEDEVPTQIRNNRFVNLISPLLDFLGTVPGYREIDISMWFLFFFGLFFAMIFGDAGYGVLLVLASGWMIFSAFRKKQKPATALFMFLYLGIMTVIWGAATCTWFGIPVDSLPPVLVSISVPAVSNANPDAQNNIKVFCFIIGLVQISLAHVIGMIRNRKSLKVIGEFGALILAIGMFYVVLSLVVDADKYPLGSPFGQAMIGLVLSGFLLNFLFINYSGKVGEGILESLKNVITMILGVVNMFGDIMSYIRLWAVGLAGAAISSTINTMAGPILGGFIIFAGIMLLLFGHGLNMVMNVLSVIVHGVRLNTLEFSNHLGLTWSGFKYEPFAETVRK